jgi:hypothetical protein
MARGRRSRHSQEWFMEFGAWIKATRSKVRCVRCFVPSRRFHVCVFRLRRGFFERQAASVQPEDAKKRASEEK